TIQAMTMQSGRRFSGRIFIDASYEGDTMAITNTPLARGVVSSDKGPPREFKAKLGVSYAIGREANSQYKETLNGVQTRSAIHHQFIKPVDPFRTPGDPKSGLLPGLHAGPPGEEGAADKRVQAYCFRLCATDVPDNRRP